MDQRKKGRPARSAKEKEKTRQNIADHALRLFQTEGFGAVSIRRLAKESGCAPMTIYAHFDGKIEILQHLWQVVFESLFAEIRQQIAELDTANMRLRKASQIFVRYWLDQPEHFRLVFMNNDISRPDVDGFLQDSKTQSYFIEFAELVRAALSDSSETVIKTDALISALIGTALCANTIRGYNWTDSSAIVDSLVDGIIGH